MHHAHRIGTAVALLLLLGLSLTARAAVTATEPAGDVRQTLSLDRGWLFHLGDIPFPVIAGQGMTYSNAKAGHAWGAAAPDYDDSDWRTLDLPHDWAVEGPFDPKANLSQGYRPRGFGWYRRYLRLNPADSGKHFELQFDGVATHCTVWVNGVLAHRNWCGYTSFYIDVTPFVTFGEEINTIVVRVDAEAQEGWWYEGAGIYRHTWLVIRDPVHIATDGVYANPVRGSDGSWNIPLEVTLGSSANAADNVEIESILSDDSGKEIARANTRAAIQPFESPVAKMKIPVSSPRLWSVDEPVMYSVKTVLKRGGALIDETTTHCGFRTIRFDADKGFFLNDQPLKLKGVCNHQDHAGVGVAVPDSLWDFRLRRLKEMGANAYRCAHNPPAKEFLDACDRLGMLVMDENRNFNTTPEYMNQLNWMVRRDRNHPSVILWSVFNEEPSQGSPEGFEMVRRMSAAVKLLDVTRPITAAQSNSMLNTINASLAADVAGFNYQPRDYDRYHKANPTKPIISSEDTSAVMTRGEYTTDKSRSVLDSYDTQFQRWGATHRRAWQAIDERPFMAGGFCWTGFDYRGETQPLEWPATGSSFGILDLCGFPKTAYYIHQALWIENKPILQLAPHWNWPGSEGKTIKVMALTNADSVALSLNGKLIAEKPVTDKYAMLSWDVPYEAGKLEAVGTRGGKEIARCVVETTGEPAAIQLIPDRNSLTGDGRDAEPITVQAIDAQGRAVPTANAMVKFELDGPGAIIGLNNGDPNCHEPEKGNQHTLFSGLAQVIVQTGRQSSGKLTLRATAEGLKAAEVEIAIAPAPLPPEVLPAKPTLLLARWRMSPVTPNRPDPNQQISRTDMNTWGNVQPGRLQPFPDGSFAIFRVTFTPRATVKKAGGHLILRDVVGKAQVYIDGKIVGDKTNVEKDTISLALPPGEGQRTVSVLIESSPNVQAGLGGAATVE